MELLTLALFIVTVASLHRVASSASVNANARALLPLIEDPLTIVLARLGFRSERHRVMGLAASRSTIIPLRYVGEVDAYTVVVSRSVDGLRAQIEVSIRLGSNAWEDARVVSSQVLVVDSMLGAAMLGSGIAEQIESGATLSFDDGELVLDRPATAKSALTTPSAIDAMVKLAKHLERGPKHLVPWAFQVATADANPYARRSAMAALLSQTKHEEFIERALEKGRRDRDVGVRLAVAAHAGDDIVEFLEHLAASPDEPSGIRRDAIEQLILTTAPVRARRAIHEALASGEERRSDALAVMTELVAATDDQASRVLRVIDDRPVLALARPILWALVVAAEETLAIEAIERLGNVGTGVDINDLHRIEASAALMSRARDAAAKIRDRIGIHGLSLVEPSDAGALSVAR